MKRFLRLTEEGAFGTFPGSPTSINIRLNQPDSFKVMTAPEFYTIMSGNGFANQALFGSQVSNLGATLSTPLDFAQATILLGWACQRINAGQTSPWVTTEVAGDLASACLDFGWSNFDGTIRRKRFLGCKVLAGSITCSKQSPVAMLNLTIVGSTPQGNTFDSSSDPTSGAFPEPADSTFPTTPVLFQHLKSGLTLNNVARSNFQSINIAWNNTGKAYFDESRFANAIRICGRSFKLSGNSRLKASPDDRASYENSATLATANTVTFNNGTHTVVFTLNAQNYFDSIAEQFPLDEEIYYSWSVMNQLDASAGSDFTFTVT
jgi:hypothetical protein